METSTSSLWTAVGTDTLAKISAARWRAWPSGAHFAPVRDRTAAVADARGLARAEGTGHVVELQLQPERFARLERQPLEPDELASALMAALVERGHYCAAIAETEVASAERTMRLRFPTAWREYLQRDVWSHRAWMDSGDYIWLYAPRATVESWEVWRDLELDDRPGMLVIGSDGGPELITIDARDPRSRVTLTGNVSEGWKDSVTQTESIEAFIEAVENGTFAYRFDD